MRLFNLFFPLAFFLLTNLFAQKDSLQKQLFLKGATAYRAEIFAQNRSKIADLAAFERKIMAIDSVRVVRYFLLREAYWQAVWRQKEGDRVRKKLLEKTNGYQRMADAFDDPALLLLEQNAALLGLRFAHVLKRTSPFEVNPKASFFEECQFYDLRDGQKIAEIGAGDGAISFLIAHSFRDAKVFINEINEKWLRLILQKVRATPKIAATGSSFLVVEGSKKSCGLEGRELDRILIRDSFHHFKKKKAMLESIKKSLAPDGLVFVLEPTRDETRPIFCKKTMWRFEIEKAWRDAGFDLLAFERIEYGRYFLFKFKVARN